MEPNGTAKNSFPEIQFGWQCLDGPDKLILEGDCEKGGTGYQCPCPDVHVEDPRVKAVFTDEFKIPIIDPRVVAAGILDLSAPRSVSNGDTLVVGNSPQGRPWACPSMAGPPLAHGSCCAPPPRL